MHGVTKLNTMNKEDFYLVSKCMKYTMQLDNKGKKFKFSLSLFLLGYLFLWITARQKYTQGLLRGRNRVNHSKEKFSEKKNLLGQKGERKTS